MSTNFLQVNPLGNNQENDSQYATDTLRVNGASTDALLPSSFWNKFAYQNSTAIAAFMQSLSNKGYVVSDASLSTLTAVLANVLTNKDIISPLATVTFATSIAFDASKATGSSGFELMLTGNVTSSTLTGQFAGEVLIFIFVQDSVGGRTFSWPSNVSGFGTIGTQANAVSIQAFVVLQDASVHALTSMVVNGATLAVISSTAVTTSGSVTNLPAQTIKVDASGGAVTLTLYSSVGAAGQTVTIKKVDAGPNTVTLATTAGQTIDGASTAILTKQNDSFTVQSDGANWIII